MWHVSPLPAQDKKLRDGGKCVKRQLGSFSPASFSHSGTPDASERRRDLPPVATPWHLSFGEKLPLKPAGCTPSSGPVTWDEPFLHTAAQSPVRGMQVRWFPQILWQGVPKINVDVSVGKDTHRRFASVCGMGPFFLRRVRTGCLCQPPVGTEEPLQWLSSRVEASPGPSMKTLKPACGVAAAFLPWAPSRVSSAQPRLETEAVADFQSGVDSRQRFPPGLAPDFLVGLRLQVLPLPRCWASLCSTPRVPARHSPPLPLTLSLCPLPFPSLPFPVRRRSSRGQRWTESSTPPPPLCGLRRLFQYASRRGRPSFQPQRLIQHCCTWDWSPDPHHSRRAARSFLSCYSSEALSERALHSSEEDSAGAPPALYLEHLEWPNCPASHKRLFHILCAAHGNTPAELRFAPALTEKVNMIQMFKLHHFQPGVNRESDGWKRELSVLAE